MSVTEGKFKNGDIVGVLVKCGDEPGHYSMTFDGYHFRTVNRFFAVATGFGAKGRVDSGVTSVTSHMIQEGKRYRITIEEEVAE